MAYRTPTSKQPQPNVGPVMYAQKAVIEVRNRAAQFGVDPQRIAMLGFSAGGQTALVAAASQPTFESKTPPNYHRPNLLLLLYPYKVMNAAEDGIREDVTIDTSMPPTFIAQAADDAASRVNGALMLFSNSLRRRFRLNCTCIKTAATAMECVRVREVLSLQTGRCEPQTGYQFMTLWTHRVDRLISDSAVGSFRRL